ncbi:MerR family transcriptional regulator [Prauserella muralis]|uniref:MerR family transcriptional regulator n=2 Tax=Prauserella muralis TaxID=588067 RepID=A0A2V4AVW1_9PSEU|nr:MerR family transcriptional regulator [Prauserella muralis]
MTIGDLAQRTGVPVKVLRRHEDLGLIYTLGRSPAGYRLFDEDALWCVDVIRTLRALGLTEAEIQHLANSHADGCQLVGPQLAEMLHRVRARTETRIRELEQLRWRVENFERRHRAALEGRAVANPWGANPRSSQHEA